MLAASAHASAQTLTIAQGTLKGEARDEVVAFKAIPYAAPPVGDNRWRAPQPAPNWKGERDATRFAADCAQAPFPMDSASIETTPSEDCLFLNVWQPKAVKKGAKLPVMVWLHGGGFVNGGASPAVYSGEQFARDGIVFVSLNYRLGRYGFFAHPGLAAEGLGGNFGLLDQIAALKWVRDNIARFGGDSANVTLFGESAGGISVHSLLRTPLSRGLFAKAIVQSGGGRDGILPTPSLADASKIGEAFAPGLTAAQLRALPAEKVTSNLSLMTMTQPGYSGPMVDGKTILGSPIDGALAGAYARIPVMIGANSADGFPFPADKDAAFAPFGAQAAQARALYDPEGKYSPLRVAVATSADRMFIEPARAIAQALAPHQPVYLYRFSYAVPSVQAMWGGAPHASEIPYVFDTVQYRRLPKMIPEEAAVAKLTHRYWINFAKTGRPDSEDVPAWPRVTANATTVQIIDGAGARNSPDPLRARLELINAAGAPKPLP